MMRSEMCPELRAVAVGIVLLCTPRAAASADSWEPAVGDSATLQLRSGALVYGRLVATTADSLTIDQGGIRGPFYDPKRVVARADVARAWPGTNGPPRSTRRTHHGYLVFGPHRAESHHGWGTGWWLAGGWTPSRSIPIGLETAFAGAPSRETGLTDLSRGLVGLYFRPVLQRGHWTSHALVALGSAWTDFDRPQFLDSAGLAGTYLGLAIGLGHRFGAWGVFGEVRHDALLSDPSADFTEAGIGLER